MSADDDMSAEASPSSPRKNPAGGRRLNNLPLVLVVTAAGLFIIVMLCAMFAKNQHRRFGDATIGVKNSADGARDNLLQNFGKIRDKNPEIKKEETSPPAPIIGGDAPKPILPVTAPPPQISAPIDQDMLRLRAQKLQRFQSALGAPLRVIIGSEYTKPKAENLSRISGVPAIGQYQNPDAKKENIGGATTAGLDRGATSVIATGSVPPSTRYVLRTGAVIPALLIGGINSDLPGQIIGQVSQNVFDTATGKHLLIPQGSRLVGEYSSETKWGQNRVFAVWQRIVFPDGGAMDLGAFPMSSGAGYAGLKDKVDNHYLRIFGSAIMMSFVVAGIEYSQKDISASVNGNSNGNDASQMSQTMSEAVGQTLGQTLVEMLRKNMNINPTLIIRPGYRLNVMLVKDLEMPNAYRAFDYMAKLRP